MQLEAIERVEGELSFIIRVLEAITAAAGSSTTYDLSMAEGEQAYSRSKGAPGAAET